MQFSCVSFPPDLIKSAVTVYLTLHRLRSQGCDSVRYFTHLRLVRKREKEGSVLFGFYSSLRSEPSSPIQSSGSELVFRWENVGIRN